MILKGFTLKPKWGRPLSYGLLVLVLFFAFRLPLLTRIPVFVDEAIYIRWSQIMRHEPSLRFLPLSDGKQPLFMWATMPALKFISDPLVAGRAVSVVAGLFAALGLAFFALIIFNNLTIAIFSALVYAVLPFTVFFDRLALVDSLLAAIGIWSLSLGALLVKKARLDLSLLLGFTIGLGLLTKSPAIFFYFWQLLLFLALFDFRPKNRRPRLLKLFGSWLIVAIVSQAIYAILRLGPNFNVVGSRNQDYVFSLVEVLRHPLNPLVGNLQSTVFWLLFLFTPPLVLALAAAFFSKYKRPSLLLVCLSLFTLLAQAFVAKVYTSRYILFAVEPLIIVIAIGLSHLSLRLHRYSALVWLFFLGWPVILSALLVTAPVKANLPYDMRSGYLEDWTAGWGQREVAAYLIQKAHGGQKIVIGTDGFFGTLPDGLVIYTQATPGITVIGGPPNITSLPASLTNSLKDRENTVYLVANASRVHLPESELARLELIAEYPKPTRADGTHESLLFFRLIR